MKKLHRRQFLTSTAAAGILGMVQASGLRAQSNASSTAFTLPALGYASSALEPVIDTMTMEIHHGRHHQAYLNNFNNTLTDISLGDESAEAIVARITTLPESAQLSVRNNGGGYVNHNLFWETMAPEGKGGELSSPLKAAIEADFGSLEAMKTAFGRAAATRFGSGWAWLIVRPDGQLKITSTPNQDSPLMRGIVPESELGTPILGLDVWEHAYYLHYQNRRGDYVTNWWRVVNWDVVSAKFAAI